MILFFRRQINLLFGKKTLLLPHIGYIKTEEELEEYILNYKMDKSDWNYACTNIKLSEKFMRKYKWHLDWSTVSICQTFSESFMLEFRWRINWQYASGDQKMSEAFVRKNKKRIHWVYFFYSQKSELPIPLRAQIIRECSPAFKKQ